MDDVPSLTPSMTRSRLFDSSLVGWFVIAVISTTAVSLAAAHTPPRFRLIGLFSIAFGSLIGWIIVLLAEKLDVQPTRRVVQVVAAVLSLSGLIGCTWETWRIEESRRVVKGNDLIAESLIEQLQSPANSGTQVRVDVSQYTAFRRYLSHRIRQLGDWPRPWPEVFWFGELATSAIFSVGVSGRLLSLKSRQSVEDKVEV